MLRRRDDVKELAHPRSCSYYQPSDTRQTVSRVRVGPGGHVQAGQHKDDGGLSGKWQLSWRAILEG